MGMRVRTGLVATLLALSGGVASAQYTPPTGVTNLPRNLTPEEQQYLTMHPLWALQTDAPTPPPTGPVECVAEFEPMDGLLITWSSTYSAGFRTIVEQIVRRTTVDATSNAYVVVSSTAQQTSAATAFAAAGANASRIRYVVSAFNTIWARDYGPRYNYEGPIGNQVRTIVDHQYNRPRPQDDLIPGVFGNFMAHKRYELGANGTTLIHGGGNFHLDAANRGYATRLVDNENPAFNEAQIGQIWFNYQNLNMTFFDGFPTSVDSTQHLDMWMQIIADDRVIISDWPNNPGSTQDVICDNAAVLMASRGYTVTRVPAYSIGGTHYTYTNMVMMNNIVIVPQYNNGPGAAVSTSAFNTIQSALTPLGKTAIQLNGDSIVTSAGVFHCIVMHVPAFKGAVGINGRVPTAYISAPVGGETFTPGQSVQISWLSDDDKPAGGTGVTGIFIELSTDDGATFPTTVGSFPNPIGVLSWSVPSGVNTALGRMRVRAVDNDGNVGIYTTPRFTIGTPVACYADCDVSGGLSPGDFTCFLGKYRAGDTAADCDSSGGLSPADFTCFLGKYRAGCP